jgi:putative DNA primase/helicase
MNTNDPLSQIAAAVGAAPVIDLGQDLAEADDAFVPEDEASFEDDGAEPPEPPEEGAAVNQDILADCARLEQNDTDNGQRLLRHFGDSVLHVREVAWHAWTGTHWDPDGGTEAVERFAQKTAKRIALEAPFLNPSPRDRDAIKAAEPLKGKPFDTLTDAEKETLKGGQRAEENLGKRRGDRRKFSVSCGNRARTVAMIAQALPHRTVGPHDLDADPMLFNVQNGTLRFVRKVVEVEDPECPDPNERRMIRQVEASVELLPHNRGHLIAKISPMTYDKAATCPRFTAFLDRFQPDEEQRRYLQLAVGRALLGGASTQVLIYLYGDGANGKSVFMETIAELLGAYAGRLKPESISGNLEGRGDQATPDFARLQGKRFVGIAELPRGAPLREGLVKTMTGGEPIPVRHLNKGFFDLTPEFIPFMSGNELPDVGGLDHGIWRRLKFVHWPVKIPDGEQRPLKEVVGEFCAESAGILNWAIEGALHFLREGLKEPAAVTALTASHREDLDPVGAFVRDCVVAVPGSDVQARMLFESFRSYCEANAIRPWTEKTFALAMKKKGFVREDKRIRRWIDIDLQDVPQRPEPRSPYGEPTYGN